MKMKHTLTIILLFVGFTGISQSIVAWTPGYEIQLSDFQSPQTEISEKLSSATLYTGAYMDFGFHMTNAEFMFTKNFNSKVKTVFNKNAAVITAPDSLTARQLVNFGQYSFDLTELYARKFRKALYEQKSTFSDMSFFQSIFDELQEEMNAESTRVIKATDLGQEEDLLAEEHAKVLGQIEELPEFCSECKPPKKKKKKKN